MPSARFNWLMFSVPLTVIVCPACQRKVPVPPNVAPVPTVAMQLVIEPLRSSVPLETAVAPA